jgi:RNA polymerase sigma-70 factor, ECF subfamily
MSGENDNREAETRKRLVGLLLDHQRRIYAYIHSLVPNPHDAEDLLQETHQVICDKFDEFQPGTDFGAWACRIAWWRVRQAKQKFARSKVIFDDAVLEAVSETAATAAPAPDARRDALQDCLRALSERDREMVLTRYERGAGVREAAEQSGRSMDAAYKALTRIRQWLFDCVSRRLASGGAA